MNVNLDISSVPCEKQQMMEQRAMNKFVIAPPPEINEDTFLQQTNHETPEKPRPSSKSCSHVSTLYKKVLEQHQLGCCNESKKGDRVENENQFLQAKVRFLQERLEESDRENVDMVHQLKLLRKQLSDQNEIMEQLKKHAAFSHTVDLEAFMIQKGLAEARLQALVAETDAKCYYQKKAEKLDEELTKLKQNHGSKLFELSNDQNAKLIDEVGNFKSHICNLKTQIQELLQELARANKTAENWCEEAKLAMEKYLTARTTIVKKNGCIVELEQNVKRLEVDLKSICGGFLFSCRTLSADKFSMILDCIEKEKRHLIAYIETLTERLQQERAANDRLMDLAAIRRARLSNLTLEQGPHISSNRHSRPVADLQLVLDIAMENIKKLETRNATLTLEKAQDAETLRLIVEGTKDRISSALKEHKPMNNA